MKSMTTSLRMLALLLASPALQAAEPVHDHAPPAVAPATRGASASHDHGAHAAAPAVNATPAPADAAPHDPGFDEPVATPAHGHMTASRFTWLKADELEAADTAAGTATRWAGSVSWGGHFDRLWLASEGERAHGHSEEIETQLYWSHAYTRWWDTTLGVRHDTGAGESRSWAALGVKGLAPYWFETEATAFVGDDGATALRLEAEYELLLTNRLILQPQLELEFYGKEDRTRLQGRGLAESEAGLRLRYEIRREFAPYVGVVWRRRHGDSADLAAAAGERVHDAEAVAGLRLWF
jgi:copper resistance protein B